MSYISSSLGPWPVERQPWGVRSRPSRHRHQAQAQTETFSERRPGTTEVRPGQFRAPEFPPPSIVDYDPKPMLVVEENLVPKAKYPVVDIHSHQRATAENTEELIAEMDALNVQVLVNLSGGSGEELREALETIRNSPVPGSVSPLRERGLERRRPGVR